MTTDAELLRRYVENRDERAFAEFVQAHLGLVYGTALRRTGGRVHLAEEIAQKVFTDLSRKATRLQRHPTLTGWLYRTTRYVTLNCLRSDQRNQKLAQNLAAMSEPNVSETDAVEWEKLRPVIDTAMDELKESDREAMLLRYFEGLSFAEVGARLQLSENAARMRTERALDKLRLHLGRRGVTSTASALGLVLAGQATAAVPTGLATSITASALIAVPATSGFLELLLMSKITVPLVSSVLASGIAVWVWTSFVPGVRAEELSALRVEHERLTKATAAGASPESVAAVAKEYSTQATAIAEAMTDRQANRKSTSASQGSHGKAASAVAVTPRGHQDRGLATPRDAGYSFAWATDVCDPSVLARMIYLDPASRERAVQILNGMPAEVRTAYPTPEAFYGLLLAASCLEAPPPGADVLEAMERMLEQVELSPGRVSFRKKGSDRNTQEYQQTADGWKYVLPLAGVEGLPGILNNETFAKLAKQAQR